VTPRTWVESRKTLTRPAPTERSLAAFVWIKSGSVSRCPAHLADGHRDRCDSRTVSLAAAGLATHLLAPSGW
jgi:hypothetical protein